MRYTKTTWLSFFGGAAALLVLSMLGPRAAHALVATLVQVVNTQASPVPTLDNSKAATLNVELTCTPDAPCGRVQPDGSIINNFVVPPGQFLVITTVETSNSGSSPVILTMTIKPASGSPSFIGRRGWLIPPAGVLQLQYPNGLVIGSGFTITTLGPASQLNGYLTAQ